MGSGKGSKTASERSGRRRWPAGGKGLKILPKQGQARASAEQNIAARASARCAAGLEQKKHFCCKAFGYFAPSKYQPPRGD